MSRQKKFEKDVIYLCREVQTIIIHADCMIQFVRTDRNNPDK